MRKLSRPMLLDLIKAQSEEIERLSGELKKLQEILKDPLIERPLPGSLTEAQADAADRFRRAQETADRYLAALHEVCGMS